MCGLSWDATTGRSGVDSMGLHRTRSAGPTTGRDLGTEYHRSWTSDRTTRARPTNSLRHLDYGTGCTRAGPSLGRTPGRAHPPLEPPGYATLRGRGSDQRLGGPEDSEQLEPAGQAERWDSILQRRHANVHLRVWGLEPTRR